MSEDLPGTACILPRDVHNDLLVRNVHPPDRPNPVPARRYNLVVVGAGTAGLVTAAGAAGLGAKVALVERHLLGGDCLNVGCVPSKCVIRASRAVAEVRDAGAFGVGVPGDPSVDFGAAMERMRRLRARISAHDSVARFQDELGVDVFLGEGRFTGPGEVEVGGARLHFRRAVVATGARAAAPAIDGLAAAGYLTNETVFSLTERPRRLAVIGAGPIGCELAQAFRRLGSEVVLLNDVAQILPREDADAAAVVARAFARDGVHLEMAAAITRVTAGPEGKTIHFTRAGAAHAATVDEILLGVGRAPNVEGLGLEAAGVAYGPRGIDVDDRLRTTNPRVYAAGDVCMRHKFTHAADFAARIVIQNTLFRGRKRLSALTIPWCTYTDPEVAHVGLSEAEAARAGVAITTFTRPLADVDRAIADGEEDGFVKVHVRAGSDRIVGATVVARHAGEMIGELTLAMTAKVGLGALANVIHPYPTQAEAIRQTGDAYNRTRLTPLVRRLFGWWLACTR